MAINAVKKTFDEIKSLKIQGATNVAVSAMNALKKTKSKKELKEAMELLKKSRPTEPMMRNGFKYVEWKMSLGFSVKQAVDDYLKLSEDASEAIAEIGARRIKDGSVVMTHCHSSAVMRVLKKAKDNGIDFSVVSCETRPLFQGRMTAKELSDYGIPVTLVVDSAMRSYVNDADLCLVGADAITADGSVINKIGTSMLALSAKEARTPFGVVSKILKFSPETFSGSLELIEERNASEVWDSKDKSIKVENKAFDVTPPEYIEFIITEKGVLNPYSVLTFVNYNYRWMI